MGCLHDLQPDCSCITAVRTNELVVPLSLVLTGAIGWATLFLLSSSREWSNPHQSQLLDGSASHSEKIADEQITPLQLLLECFKYLVLSGACICSHTLMQTGRLFSTASTSCSSCWANLTSWCQGNCLTFPACADNIFILLGVRNYRTSPSRLDFQMPSSGTVLTTDSMAKSDR